jgi:hypothetical protein
MNSKVHFLYRSVVAGTILSIARRHTTRYPGTQTGYSTLTNTKQCIGQTIRMLVPGCVDVEYPTVFECHSPNNTKIVPVGQPPETAMNASKERFRAAGVMMSAVQFHLLFVRFNHLSHPNLTPLFPAPKTRLFACFRPQAKLRNCGKGGIIRRSLPNGVRALQAAPSQVR